MSDTVTLAELRTEFGASPFLAMPLAGSIAWTAVAVGGLMFPTGLAAWVLFIATGSTFGLGVFLSRFTGEDLLGKSRPNNELDRLFLITVVMSNLVWAIAIPFFMIEPTSLPLSVGILAGLMWLPFSWMIQHWVGYFHAFVRTALIVMAWIAFPDQRFVVIPLIIVGVYAVSIAALIKRHAVVRAASTVTA